MDATEDAAAFTPENLAHYRAIVFLNSSGEVFDERQKAAFQGFIRGGGGLAAVHQGITTLEKWPWYVALVGGVKFAGHPKLQEATCRREDRDHPATKDLPDSWKRVDEWYNFEPNPRAGTHVLLTVDESSYQGGTMGKDHPVSWFHEAEGGRVWCTALGHTEEGYGGQILRKHLLGGIRYAAGLAPAGAGGAKAGARRLGPQKGASVAMLKNSGDPASQALRLVPAREAYARHAREHPGDPAPRAQAVLRPQGRGLRALSSGQRRGGRHRAGPLRRRGQVRASPADRVGARTSRARSSKAIGRRSSPPPTDGSSRGSSRGSRPVS